MATTKKTTTKKAPVKKAAPKKTTTKATVAKTTVRKKAPAKTTAKKQVTKKSNAQSATVRSFRVAPSEQSFTTFKITRQTVYWIILVAFIIFAQLWILKLQIEVASIIERQQTDILNNF